MTFLIGEMEMNRFKPDHDRCIGPTELNQANSQLKKINALERYLRGKIKDLPTWLPLAERFIPEFTLQKTIETIRDLLVKIEAEREELIQQKKLGAKKRGREQPEIPSNFDNSFSFDRELEARLRALGVIQQTQQQSSCPDNIIYLDWQKRPTDFRELYWSPPDDIDHYTTGGRNFEFIGPAANSNSDVPTRVVNQPDQATGISFSAFIKDDTFVKDTTLVADTSWTKAIIGIAIGRPEVFAPDLISHVATDVGNRISTCFLFQYKFSPVPCDMTLDWTVYPYFNLPNGMEIIGENPNVWIENVTYQGPNGEGFPQLEDLTFHDGRKPGESTTERVSRLNHVRDSMQVSAGVAPTLYVGLSFYFSVNNGLVCTYECVNKDNETLFDNGVFEVLGSSLSPSYGVAAVGIPQ